MCDACETAARAIDASVIICDPDPDERAEIVRISAIERAARKDALRFIVRNLFGGALTP